MCQEISNPVRDLTQIFPFLTVCYTINTFGTFSFTIVASGMFLSATTTAIATFLVALKIVRVTRRDRVPTSYAKIIEILVESAFMQSVILIASGLCLVAVAITFNDPLGDGKSRLWYGLNSFTTIFRVIIMVRTHFHSWKVNGEHN